MGDCPNFSPGSRLFCLAMKDPSGTRLAVEAEINSTPLGRGLTKAYKLSQTGFNDMSHEDQSMKASPSIAQPIQMEAILRDEGEGPIWMQGVAFAWFLSTFAIFPGNEFFLYPLALVFIVTLFFERDRVMPILARCWWIFLIPILSLISFAWSSYPAETIRFGMFFILSALSLVIIGALLSARQILRAFFFCAVAGTALAITELPSIQATAVSEYLGQKNFYAMKMMVGMITGFAVAMNKEENPLIRMLGLIMIPINLYLVLAANSTTSMLLSFLALVLLILFQLFWVSSRGIKGLRTLIAGLGCIVLSLGALLALGAVNSSVVSEALGALGKDTTLTGRTALWEQASRTSAEHPVLGVGVGSFWQYDVGAAQTLAENDHRDPGTALGFHSSYWESRVHLGWTGLLCLIFAIGMVIWKAGQTFFAQATLERSCFFVAALIIFAMSFTESFLFGFFQPAVYIFNLAGITAIVSGYRERRVTLNLIPEDDMENITQDRLVPA